MTSLLPDAAVDGWLESHPDWSRDGAGINRSVQAASFLAGLDLVQRVGALAEERDHHPDIDIRWRTVTFRLSTHTAGGVTELDLRLAEAIDELT